MRPPGLVVLVVLAACGGARPRPAEPPTLVVVETGAEPRQVLRYTPKLHVPERIEVRIKVRMATAFTNTVLEKGRFDADLPTIVLVGRLEASGDAPDGDTVISYEIVETGVLADVVDPALHRALEPEVAALKGLRGSWRRTPSGLISDLVIDPAKAARANRAGLAGATDAIRQAGALFPDAAVGIGAIWKSTSEYTYSGVHWKRTVTYRLKDLVGDLATVEVSAAMRASSQALSVEPNASRRLTSGTMSVTGVLTIPLHGLVAAGEARETSELNLMIVDGRMRVTSTVRTEALETFKALGN